MKLSESGQLSISVLEMMTPNLLYHKSIPHLFVNTKIILAGVCGQSAVSTPESTESKQASIPSEQQFKHADPGRK